MRKWLARLSFSFFIFAGVLFWDTWRSSRGTGPALSRTQITLRYAGVVVLLALGMTGTRERHRAVYRDDRERRNDEDGG